VTANEVDIIEKFQAVFSPIKNEPLILYGLGEKTKLLLDNLPDYNFIALMDKNAVGCTVFSKQVITPSEVFGKSKYIIIVATYSSVRIIYQRIAGLRKHGITIFYMNGEVLDFESADQPILEYKETSRDLQNAILNHDIISFDIFDTLVCRKLLYPGDIFLIIERRLNEDNKKLNNFAAIRINAEKIAQNADTYYNLDSIYAEIKAITGLDDYILDYIKELEIATELNYMSPRKEIIEAVRFAQSTIGQIIFTSDMYLSSGIIKEILRKCGLDVTDNFVVNVSCEQKKSKYDGTLFEYYRKLYVSKKILHIGDDDFADIVQAKKYGITAFKILSNICMFENSIFKKLNVSGHLLDDRIVLGHFAAQCFNDPFSINNTPRKTINNITDIGYLFFGPLATAYVVWLLQKAAEYKVDKILFISRDGYILDKLYKKVAVKKPEGFYFYTSRRTAGVCSMQDRQDIIEVFNAYYMARNITLAQFFESSFGIEACDEDKTKSLIDFSKADLCDYIISAYEHDILKNAQNERIEYEQYIQRCNIKTGEKIGVINLAGTGVTQFFFDKIFKNNDIHFFYFLTTIDMKNIKVNQEKVHALYGEFLSPFTCTTNSLVRHYLMAESVFSSPDEQFVKFKNGEPVFKEDFGIRHFEQIKLCHQGIEEFFDDLSSVDKNIFSRTYNHVLMDKIFGSLFDDQLFYVPDEIKGMFTITDGFSSGKKLEGLW
jgi:predicted HAD superfamily hydrolase